MDLSKRGTTSLTTEMLLMLMMTDSFVFDVVSTIGDPSGRGGVASLRYEDKRT